MADETSTDQTTEPAAETEPAQVEAEPEDQDVQEIAAKAENPDAVSRALKAEREAARKAKRELEAALAKVKEYEDRDKTEQEKLAEENARLKAFEGENLRLRVAAEKDLPAGLIDRLHGDNREELEADADKLLELFAAKARTTSADMGARGSNPAGQVTREQLQSMTPEQQVQALNEGRLKDALAGGS